VVFSGLICGPPGAWPMASALCTTESTSPSRSGEGHRQFIESDGSLEKDVYQGAVPALELTEHSGRCSGPSALTMIGIPGLRSLITSGPLAASESGVILLRV
jgi:hypothetical protein